MRQVSYFPFCFAMMLWVAIGSCAICQEPNGKEDFQVQPADVDFDGSETLLNTAVTSREPLEALVAFGLTDAIDMYHVRISFHRCKTAVPRG